MLTIELRTIDLKRVVKLWGTDKETLIDELMKDYEMLVREYRNAYRSYTQNNHRAVEIWTDLYSIDKINYKKELEIDEGLWGNIKFTKDFKENLKIADKIDDMRIYMIAKTEAYHLKDIIRLKVREIEDLLLELNVKVDYEKDFTSNVDKWRRYDIDELNNK